MANHGGFDNGTASRALDDDSEAADQLQQDMLAASAASYTSAADTLKSLAAAAFATAAQAANAELADVDMEGSSELSIPPDGDFDESVDVDHPDVGSSPEANGFHGVATYDAGQAAASSPAPGGASPAAGADASLPDYHVLNVDHIEEIEEFRRDLQLCDSDEERHALCLAKRSELLAMKPCHKVLVSGFDSVMCQECETIKAERAAADLKIKANSNDPLEPELLHWSRDASEGTKCLATLRAVQKWWGLDRIRYYQWAYRGQFFCNKLRGAALGISDWDEARIKLNRLIHRWSRQNSRKVKVDENVNPVKPDDLISLKAWSNKKPFVKKNDPNSAALPYRKLTEDELPEGYAFDRYGLMVHESYAANSLAPPPSVITAPKAPSKRPATPGPTKSKRRASMPLPRPHSKKAKDRGRPRKSAPGGTLTPDSEDDDDDFDDAVSLKSDQPDEAHEERVLEGPWKSSLRPRVGKAPLSRQKKNGKRKVPMKITEIDYEMPPRCCAETVPLGLIAVLDGRGTTTITDLLEHGTEHFEKGMCPHHVQEYATILNSLLPHGAAAPIAPASWNQAFTLPVSRSPSQNAAVAPEVEAPAVLPDLNAEEVEVLAMQPSTNGRRRPRSLSDVGLESSSKRPCLGLNGSSGSLSLKQSQTIPTPQEANFHDLVGDVEYKKLWFTDMQEKVDGDELVPDSRGNKVAELLWKILQRARPPRTGDEALFVTGAEAEAILESGAVVDEPIFTQGQQPFQWKNDGCRPIVQFLRRMQDMGQTVSVQIPSRNEFTPSFESHKIADVRNRFLHGAAGSDDPWNVLDLRSPLPQCILPKFLTGENCQLLPRIRDIVLSGESAERVFAAREEWNEWTDVLEWVLLSQGGHNTAPHCDGNGLATWITCQEGRIGFGWLSRPSNEERVKWMQNFDTCENGEWRYVVLKPGQTVFFNSGTVHFVFRAGDEQTLAVGGHILQWSGIERWIRILIDEYKHPMSTNEEMTWSGPNYVRVVAELVKQRVKEGRTDEMGGQAVVQRFFEGVKEFKTVWNESRAASA